MRNMKDSFTKVEEWRSQTGVGLLEKGKEDTVKGYIKKICPHYEILKKIFGKKKNINRPVICDTKDVPIDKMLFNDKTIKMELDAGLHVEDESAEEGEHNNEAEQSYQNETGGLLTEDAVQMPGKNYSADRIRLSMKKPRKGDRRTRLANSSLQYITMLQEKRNELKEKKLDRQIAIEEEYREEKDYK